MATGYIPGLEGVVAAETRLSQVDGQAGELFIAGYPVEELAGRVAFEETVYLLWNGALPDREQLQAFSAGLAAHRRLPPIAWEALRAGAARRVPVMDALRMVAGLLDLERSDSGAGEGLAILAKFPTIVAGYWRLLQELPPVEPDLALSHAANYLYMLTGEIPEAERTRGLETYLNTVIDHGLNASTFTARVIISTGSDLLSAVVGAIGALKGPLHGGAPGPALDLVFEIGAPNRAEAVLREKLDRRERLMGFGHRVYRVRDPRAEVLSAAAERLYQRGGDLELYHLVKIVEGEAVRLLAEYHPEREIHTNVEFYTALLLHGLELPKELFSPTFAISRAAGWIAHAWEQRSQNRLIRPQSAYVGPRGLRWVPLEERAQRMGDVA